MPFHAVVTQAPHASFENGGEGADSRQYWARRSQRTNNGPRIEAAIAGIAAGEFRTVWADSANQIFNVQLPVGTNAGDTFNTLDWTPHGVWHEPTRQVLWGGRRGLVKIAGYSDTTGDYRVLPMPLPMARVVAGTVHFYGYIAQDPTTGIPYFGDGNSDVYALDPASEEWTRLPSPPALSGGNGGSLSWCDDTGRLAQYSGSVQAWRTIEPGVDVSWTSHATGVGHGMHAVIRYHPDHARHLMVGGTSTTRRASLVTSGGVVTQVTDVPDDIAMSTGSWTHAHPAGCWIVKTMGTTPKVYACWPNATLDDVTWVDLGTAPDAALSLPTLVPGYSSDVVLIVSTSGLHAWRVPVLSPPGTSAITPAAGVATTSTFAGRSIARAAITPAAGVATTSTLAGAGLEAGRTSITPAAGAATAAAIAAKVIARASFVAAAGSATAATMASFAPAAPTITIRLVDAASAGSPLPSLTGIHWAWWDSATRASETWGVAPTDSGSTESTDGAGTIVIEALSSAKTSGQQALVSLEWVDGDNVRIFTALRTVD